MKHLIIIFIFTLAVFHTGYSQVPDSSSYQSLEPKAFQERLLSENGALLLDVREYFEFKKSRIKGAINVPTSGGFETASDTIDKEKALFIYCHSGGRSKKANLYFYDKGFHNLYNLKGGITQWKKDGMSVEKRRVRK